MFADIHEFYTYTLEDSDKTVDVKTSETLQLVERWENQDGPIPAEIQEQAKHTLVCGVNSPCFSPWSQLCGCFLLFTSGLVECNLIM